MRGRRLQLATSLFVVFFAFAILIASVMRSASVRYAFKLAAASPPSDSFEEVYVDYELPYHGRVIPGHVLWPAKVVRDKMWLVFTTNPLKDAEIMLLFADKRASAAQKLLMVGEFETGMQTLLRGERYLSEACEKTQEARNHGMDTHRMWDQLARASLKHREIAEMFMASAPNDATPFVTTIVDYSKSCYERASDAIINLGGVPPIDPFLE